MVRISLRASWPSVTRTSVSDRPLPSTITPDWPRLVVAVTVPAIRSRRVTALTTSSITRSKASTVEAGAVVWCRTVTVYVTMSPASPLVTGAVLSISRRGSTTSIPAELLTVPVPLVVLYVRVAVLVRLSALALDATLTTRAPISTMIRSAGETTPSGVLTIVPKLKRTVSRSVSPRRASVTTMFGLAGYASPAARLPPVRFAPTETTRAERTCSTPVADEGTISFR